jgi:hypothetical protein
VGRLLCRCVCPFRRPAVQAGDTVHLCCQFGDRGVRHIISYSFGEVGGPDPQLRGALSPGSRPAACCLFSALCCFFLCVEEGERQHTVCAA